MQAFINGLAAGDRNTTRGGKGQDNAENTAIQAEMRSPARAWPRIAAQVCAILVCALCAQGCTVGAVATGDDTEARLAALEAEVEDLQAQVDDHETTIAHQAADIDACVAELDATQDRVDALEAEELPERVSDLESRVDTLWAAVEALYQ